MERKMFAAAIELALFKITDDPCGPLVKQSLVQFDNGFEYEYPLVQFNKEVKLPFDRQQFLDHIAGQNPMDTVEYARGGEYTKQTNAFLERLSAGRLMAIRCDSNAGMGVEQRNGTVISVFAMSSGELATIKLAARLADFELDRYACQIITCASVGQMDQTHTALFYGALMETLRPKSQVVFLGRLVDALGSPLTMVAPNTPIIDLDDKEQFDANEEEGVSK